MWQILVVLIQDIPNPYRLILEGSGVPEKSCFKLLEGTLTFLCRVGRGEIVPYLRQTWHVP